jgi:hypothetical protein
MARDLGEDPIPVILQAFAEAARDADDKRTLAKLARRLGAACVALLAAAPLMMHSSPAVAEASQNAQQNAAHPIHYAQWLVLRIAAQFPQTRQFALTLEQRTRILCRRIFTEHSPCNRHAFDLGTL